MIVFRVCSICPYTEWIDNGTAPGCPRCGMTEAQSKAQVQAMSQARAQATEEIAVTKGSLDVAQDRVATLRNGLDKILRGRTTLLLSDFDGGKLDAVERLISAQARELNAANSIINDQQRTIDGGHKAMQVVRDELAEIVKLVGPPSKKNDWANPDYRNQGDVGDRMREVRGMIEVEWACLEAHEDKDKPLLRNLFNSLDHRLQAVEARTSALGEKSP